MRVVAAMMDLQLTPKLLAGRPIICVPRSIEAVQQEMHVDRARPADGEGPAALLEILKSINERTCNKKCAVGSGGKSVG